MYVSCAILFFFPILKLKKIKKNKIKGSRETKSKAMAICLLSQGQLMQPSPIFSVLYTIISPKPPISFHPTKKREKKKAHQFSFLSLSLCNVFLLDLFFFFSPSSSSPDIARTVADTRKHIRNTRKMTLDLIQIQRSDFLFFFVRVFLREN